MLRRRRQARVSLASAMPDTDAPRWSRSLPGQPAGAGSPAATGAPGEPRAGPPVASSIPASARQAAGCRLGAIAKSTPASRAGSVRRAATQPAAVRLHGRAPSAAIEHPQRPGQHPGGLGTQVVAASDRVQLQREFSTRAAGQPHPARDDARVGVPTRCVIVTDTAIPARAWIAGGGSGGWSGPARCREHRDRTPGTARLARCRSLRCAQRRNAARAPRHRRCDHRRCGAKPRPKVSEPVTRGEWPPPPLPDSLAHPASGCPPLTPQLGR